MRCQWFHYRLIHNDEDIRMSFRVALVSACDDALTSLWSRRVNTEVQKGRVAHHYHMYVYTYMVSG